MTEPSDSVPADRESHFLRYALDGHSQRHVAERLFISENAVKAHLKAIFAKMGIHSKNSLEHILPIR